jgi:hypothetical protein
MYAKSFRANIYKSFVVEASLLLGKDAAPVLDTWTCWVGGLNPNRSIIQSADAESFYQESLCMDC